MSIFNRKKKELEAYKTINKTLFNTIDLYIDEVENAKEQLRIAKHNNIILIENSQELRNRIKDLENNIEILVNNLSPAKKKLLGYETIIEEE